MKLCSEPQVFMSRRSQNDSARGTEASTLIFACLTDGQRERIAQNAADLRVQKAEERLIREGEVPSVLCPA